MRRCIAIAIVTQGPGVLLHASGFRVTEEQQHRIANIFVDSGAVCERNRRHLGQILIQNIRQLLRFQLVRSLCEACDVGKENGQLLALGGNLDCLRPGEDQLIYLRR